MTAMGRRSQLFSPVPEINGNAIKNPTPIRGPTMSKGVSNLAGSSASAAKDQRKKKSGRGTA